MTSEQVPSITATQVATIASCVAAAITLVATWHGPGMGPDSVNYVAAGLNFATGDGLRTFNGDLLTMFPPGLSAIVAAGDVVGLGDAWTLRLVNAAAAAAIVWMGASLLRRHVSSRSIVIGGTVVLAVSCSLLSVAEMALSECVFTAVTLGFLLCVERALDPERHRGWLIAAAALVWIGFLLRYSGLALVPAGAFALLIGLRSRGWIPAIVQAGVFCVTALLVPVSWMLRNLRVDDTLMGPRSPSPDGLPGTIQRYVATMGRWVLPEPTPVVIEAAAGVAVVLVALAVGIWALADPGRRAVVIAPREVAGAPAPSILALASFAVVYSGYLIAAQLATAFDPIGMRLMAPLQTPILVLALVGLDRVRPLFAEERRRPIVVASGVVLVGLVVFQAVCAGLQIRTSASEGIEYSAVAWQESELIGAVAELPEDVRLYSNVPAGVWAVLRREPITRSPERKARRSPLQIPMSEEFVRRARCETTYLAWSDEAVGDYLFTPEQLAEHVQLTEVTTAGDGTLYRVGPLPGTDGEPC